MCGGSPFECSEAAHLLVSPGTNVMGRFDIEGVFLLEREQGDIQEGGPILPRRHKCWIQRDKSMDSDDCIQKQLALAWTHG